MKHLHPALIGVTLTGIMLLPVAHADDDTGLYISASANRLSADFKDTSDVDFDDSDTAGGLRIGYMTNPFLGFELGYLDLGDYEAEGDTPGNRISLDGSAFTGAIILNWELVEQIDVYGKVGAFYIEADSASNVAGRRISANEDATEIFGGIGVELDLGRLTCLASIQRSTRMFMTLRWIL
ncbi:MAG: outer membrane beta-barrel protein [bacterium]